MQKRVFIGCLFFFFLFLSKLSSILFFKTLWIFTFCINICMFVDLCRKWNWWQCERAWTTLSTEDINLNRCVFFVAIPVKSIYYFGYQLILYTRTRARCMRKMIWDNLLNKIIKTKNSHNGVFKLVVRFKNCIVILVQKLSLIH